MTQQVTFLEESHQYFIGKIEYISVTTVMKDFGLIDLSGIPEHILETARQFGKAIHKLTHLYDTNNIGKYDKKLEPWLDAWIKFRKDYKDIDEIIVDEKSGQKYPDHAIQTAGYKLLVEEIPDKSIHGLNLMEKPLVSEIWRFAGTPDRVWSTTGKIKHRWTVYLSEGKYKVEKHKEKSDLSVFRSLMSIYNWKRKAGLIQ